MLFNPSRDEVRLFFCETWRKAGAKLVLTPLEAMALEWIEQHPEYHALLNDSEKARTEDFTPERGIVNPFLHLSMHLSIAEQISINQPPGIRIASEQLSRKLNSLHEAHHQIMDCLGEVIWRAQRDRQPPDGQAYIDGIMRRVKG